MSCISFELDVHVSAAPPRVYEELADPARQIGLQPLLREVVDRGRGRDPDGVAYRAFDARESVPVFLGLRFPNRISVRVRLSEPAQVIDFVATSWPWIRVESRFELRPIDGGARCHVLQHVQLTAPRLISRFVAAEAEAAQRALLANLATRFGR